MALCLSLHLSTPGLCFCAQHALRASASARRKSKPVPLAPELAVFCASSLFCTGLLRLPSVVLSRARARQWALQQVCRDCIDHCRGLLQHIVPSWSAVQSNSRLAGVPLSAVQPPCAACKPGGADRIQPLLGAVCVPLQHRPAQAVAEGSAPGQGASTGAAPEWGGPWHTGDKDASPTSSDRFDLSAENIRQWALCLTGSSDRYRCRAIGAVSGVLIDAQCCFFGSTRSLQTQGQWQGQQCQPCRGTMTMRAACLYTWPVMRCLWQLLCGNTGTGIVPAGSYHGYKLPATADCRPQRCQSR